MKKILSLVMLVIGFIGSAQNELPKSETDIAPLLIGEKIPNITLQSPDGKSVALESILKKNEPF